MKLLVVPLISLGLLAAGGPALADEPGRSLSLEQAVAQAMADSPQVLARRHAAAAAELSAKAESRRRWGDLSFQGSYNRLNDDQMVRPIAPELLEAGFAGLPFDRNQLHLGLVAELPLYLGGQLGSRRRISEINAETARQVEQATRWQIRFNAISVYAGAVALERATLALDDELDALGKTRERIALAVTSGKRPRIDLLKIEDQVQETIAARAKTAAGVTKLRALLASILGQTPEKLSPLAGLEARAPELLVPRPELADLVLKASAIERARLGRRAAEQNTRLSRGALLPQVVVQGEYLEHLAPSVGSDLETWRATIALKVPIFAGGSRYARLAAARQSQLAAAAGEQQTRLGVLARLEDGLAAFDAARESLAASIARREAADEAARIEQIRYDAGAGAIEDLLRARARQSQAAAASAAALAETYTAAAQLDTLSEKEVTR